MRTEEEIRAALEYESNNGGVGTENRIKKALLVWVLNEEAKEEESKISNYETKENKNGGR